MLIDNVSERHESRSARSRRKAIASKSLAGSCVFSSITVGIVPCGEAAAKGEQIPGLATLRRSVAGNASA
ncbi:MAG: hypothetical protein ACRELF_23755, partial [Gemmataceae bacterium]